MKRFLLFAGNVYYPSGGFGDFIGDFEALEDAKDKLLKWIEAEGNPGYLWAHIYDTETMKVMYKL
tara:strand:- start:237 stop:431 length:195 start_codon:yes stop_codon:yes gene_type:complete